MKSSMSIILALAALLAVVQEQNALPFNTGAVSCAKESILGWVRNKVVGKESLMGPFRETIARVNQRYQAAIDGGLLEGRDEIEKSNLYNQYLAEELRQLRAQVEKGKYNQDTATNEVDPQDKIIQSCLLVAEGVDEKSWNPSEASDADLLDGISIDDFEKIALDEEAMGWSLSEETKEAIKLRTKSVVSDLLNNELRQLAIAVLGAYTGGTWAPVWVAINGTLKFKLVEYAMNSLLDIISSLVGRRIDITPGIYPELLQPEPLNHMESNNNVPAVSMGTTRQRTGARVA